MDFCSLVLGHCRLGVIPVTEGKPGRSLLVIPFNLSWTEAEEAGALSLPTTPPTAHIICQEPTLSLSIELPVEITWQYWNTWQHMVPDEIRKRTWKFHGESLLPLLLLSSEVLGHLEIWHYPHVRETHPDCWIPFNGSFKLRCTLRHKASWGKCTYPVLVIGRAVDSRGHSKVLDRMCAGKEQSFWDLWEG